MFNKKKYPTANALHKDNPKILEKMTINQLGDFKFPCIFQTKASVTEGFIMTDKLMNIFSTDLLGVKEFEVIRVNSKKNIKVDMIIPSTLAQFTSGENVAKMLDERKQ